MSYKKSNWVPYDPTLSFEQNVTQGGTTTADKLNNMETGIGNAFDKTSDTIGGRNLLIGSTDNIVHYSSVTGYTVWKSYVTQFNIGDTLNVSADVTSNAGNTVLKVFFASSTGIQLGYLSQSVSEGQTAHVFVSKVIPTGTASILVQIDNSNSNGIGQADVCAINHQFANTGSVVANWTPAPEDKVNVSDMRKPASDVAGIEEVNAKQDKIGYTPADDSKVVHSADTSNWQKDKVTNDDGTPFVKLISSSQDLSATLMSLGLGLHTVYANGLVVNSPFNGVSPAKGVIDIQGNSTGSNAYGEGFLIGTKPSQGILMYHVWLDGSKANYTQIAKDSKVAHLSGANNFDTTPTVNNNPVATTDDVTTASNTVLTSANTSISKLLQSSSNNDEDSAVTNSTSDTSNFYYWTE